MHVASSQARLSSEIGPKLSSSTLAGERRETSEDLARSREFLRATLDSLPANIAVLDERGEIIMTNRAWRAFALDNGSLAPPAPGADYLAVCDAADDDPLIAEVAAGLRAIIAGTSRDFASEYACHSPTAERWFALRATSYDGPGPARVVLIHDDITSRSVDSERARKAHQRNLELDVETLSWVARVQDALEEDRLVLYAQPIIDVRSGEVVQRELLLRMLSEDGEIVAPGFFLPVAEKYGLIGDIDRWVIEHAIEIAGRGTSVQINLSARSVGDPAVLEDIERCLKRTGADPGLLVFEITETALIGGEVNAKEFADRLRALGCGLALDDFGTGYGGLTYLKQMPIDFLKIDIEFVRDIRTNPASRHVIEAVVALARAFDLQTVGEGVEDSETLELLRDLDVDFAQGYHIARPAPLEA